MHNFGKNEWNSTISTRWTKVGKYGQTWTIWKIGQFGHFEKIGQYGQFWKIGHNLRNIQNQTKLDNIDETKLTNLGHSWKNFRQYPD